MEYREFVADLLPMTGRISCSSAEENEAFMQQNGITQHVLQRGKGKFRADYAMWETDQAILLGDRFSLGCSAYLEPPAGTVALMLFRSAGGQFLASGENVANDALVVLPDGHGVDLVTPKLAGTEALVLPKSNYARLTQLLCPDSAPAEGVAILRGDTRQLHRMRDALLHIMAAAGTRDREIACLVRQMIVWSGDCASPDRPMAPCNRRAGVHVAKQVQAYLEEHYRESVLISDLCRATGKEVRTLQSCFRRYFDMTITDYLKVVRLNSAFRALSAAQPSEATVTAVALGHGFTHLGRFSVAYSRQFGESARATLHRRHRS